ncbi:Chanoclavine-I aldehyde reductase fgaOx3 [Hyphodiscus hymeniophilus]|uniref:Chanoclavine-I aldehyde reductase fgaOx3 n=1 Tax=Hyphodiscus hymeniophilus TaxID=353542 RepID=A0A9P6VKR7_9HELO|nr:Chanoclavine-I aldehyde reductase fgaOx3 [Hyphodiscus hymeniophilus]
MSKLFTPLKVGQVTLQHRVAMAPLTRFRVDNDHIPLPFVKEYYEQRASVPGTLLVTEATLISPRAGGYPNVPGIHNEAQIKAWKEVTEAVHGKGSFIFCQLWALGRAAQPGVINADGFDYVSSSAVATEEGLPVPRALTEEEIVQFITDYANAAKSAIAAGFDGVEIHGANGYLVDQFTQDNCNKRTDSWGGSVENRARFAIEVTKSIIDAVGAKRTAIRFSPWNDMNAMKMKDPQPQFSYIVSALKKLKIAYIHFVESRNDETEKLDFLTDIWGKTSPVLIAGSLTRGGDGLELQGSHPSRAKAVLEKYPKTDVVTVFGRYFISNPDLPFRLKKGLALTEYDRSTFYKVGSRDGYTDLPFSKEFQASIKVVA